jgi:hypothetical protein
LRGVEEYEKHSKIRESVHCSTEEHSIRCRQLLTGKGFLRAGKVAGSEILPKHTR